MSSNGDSSVRRNNEEEAEPIVDPSSSSSFSLPAETLASVDPSSSSSFSLPAETLASSSSLSLSLSLPAETLVPASNNSTDDVDVDANDSSTLATKKQAWNSKPTGGVHGDTIVMGAESWPALAESRASPKLDSSTDSPKGIVERQATKLNTSQKLQPVARQQSRYSRQGGGGGGSSTGRPTRGTARGFYRPLPPRPPPPFPVVYHDTMVDPLHGRPFYRPNIWDSTPAVPGFVQTNFVTNQHNFFHGYHNNCYHLDPRMHDHAHFHNHFSRPRGGAFPPRGGFRSPFPPPLVPYTAQLPQYPFPPNMPFVPPRPSVHRTLSADLVRQIEFYFSDGNLITDTFLRSRMDDQGWVPISLLATFPKVKKMTSDIKLIAEALRTSFQLEVQNNKIRKRNGWIRWPLNFNGEELHLEHLEN